MDYRGAQGLDVTQVFRVINEHTREPLENLVNKVLRTGVIHGIVNHTLLLRRNSGEIPIENSCAPIRTSTGSLFGVVLVFKDLSARRRAEHAQGWLAPSSRLPTTPSWQDSRRAITS